MSAKDNTIPSTQSVLDDFEQALERLQANRPQHVLLLAKSKTGRLKVSLSNLALEAGHSRTLISGRACQYPEIRDRALQIAVKANAKPAKATKQIISDLREENVKLRQQLEQISTSYAEVLLRIYNLQGKYNNEVERSALLMQEANRKISLIPNNDFTTRASKKK